MIDVKDLDLVQILRQKTTMLQTSHISHSIRIEVLSNLIHHLNYSDSLYSNKLTVINGIATSPPLIQNQNNENHIPLSTSPKWYLEQYQTKKTLIFKSLQTRSSFFAQSCYKFFKTIDLLCQVNAYISPPNTTALPAHSDLYPIFVAQIEGEKFWKIENDEWIKLKAGDVLFIPAGIKHQAKTENQNSVHLTYGLHFLTAKDLDTKADSDIILLFEDDFIDKKLIKDWFEFKCNILKDYQFFKITEADIFAQSPKKGFRPLTYFTMANFDNNLHYYFADGPSGVLKQQNTMQLRSKILNSDSTINQELLDKLIRAKLWI